MPVPALNKDALLRSEHQLGMVMDLNKCIGCQTCTVACKTLWTGGEGQDTMYWMNVETRPGEGYPRGAAGASGGWTADGATGRAGRLPPPEAYGTTFELNHEEALRTPDGGRLAPTEEPAWGVNWDEDVGFGPYPASFHFYLPRLCNHCTHPACVAACPRNALYKRDSDGIVLLSQERCHGYRFCVEACPYEKVYWNHVAQVSQKCIFCYPRIDQGIPTACSTQCVGQVRFVGLVDDPDGPIHRLVHEWKVALPLLPDRGTQPNVFYIPPTAPEAVDADGKPRAGHRIPLAYLESLFGRAVGPALETLDGELAKLRRGERSELMEVLSVRDYRDLFRLPGAPEQGGAPWFGAFAADGARARTVDEAEE